VAVFVAGYALVLLGRVVADRLRRPPAAAAGAPPVTASLAATVGEGR